MPARVASLNGGDGGACSSGQSSACWSKASHMRRAASRFSGVSTFAVWPQATGSRASSSVSGKCARTKSMSCMAVSTVRRSPCQRCTRSNRSAEVLASTALNGSSSTITCASCSKSRANSIRCIWPPERVAMARSSKPERPTASIACSIEARAARSMRPNDPARRHSPIATMS